MESQPPLLAALCLLGVMVIPCLGRSHWEDSGFQLRLGGSYSKCQGQLEVYLSGMWRTVDSQSWSQRTNSREGLRQASQICRKLSCGNALIFDHIAHFNSPQSHATCLGQVGSFSNCSFTTAGQREPLSLICLEPQKTTPPPTRPPPTTTPEPTAPPRLQLVSGPQGLRCAGVVEFYRGSLGGTIRYKDEDGLEILGHHICQALQCGSFLKPLREDEATGIHAPGGSRPLPIRWKIQNASRDPLEQCFRRARPGEDGRPLALVCADFQPKVQSRLVGGSDVCAGSVEVRQGRQWETLCYSSAARGAARWQEVCQQQRCGNVTSYQVQDVSEKTSRGLSCPWERLSQCYQLQEKTSHCKRVFVTCQDRKQAGLGAGTLMSIILALVLLAVLLVMCGPLAYKKLVKKFRQKKQRQWIGPTAMNQNMSFHRDHATTVRRSQVENAPGSHGENEYSQPPRNSQVSAYPALEGALHRVSTQPDNSSDSDYDLHGAQRL
ncbi:T-cell surface glycoprotein CD5 [Saccopteryx bilineata]|uniref:T-cell surface glycoprotein CD5 n=1 Tax=Saccopteryx bilineata TaxID=59482 RepID=UPI00338D3FF8